MGNSALGAALTIPQSALNAIKEADQKLKDIQNTAKNTAVGVAKSFKDMAVGTQPFLDSLDKVIAKLNTINASAANASGSLNNIGASAGNMSGNITQASQNIQQMVAQLSNMKGAGTSGIMQAVLAFQRLQEATKGASGMNIAELKKEIGAIDSILKDVNYNLTKTDQDSLIKRKKTLQDELKYQQQMCEERVIAFQKALDKMSSAEASFNAKQRKAYSDKSKGYQEKNYEQNTSYKGALDFSAAANTLNRQARAIEYLKEARMKLSQTDADYKQKLEALNAAIAQHTKNLKEAGVNTKQLGEQTSYMSGYISRWAQRMAFAFSINTLQGFVGQIAEVRGQFELSQRSLEAILQNKPKADEIFNKTVELAIKSPFRIKDLVDYTRQLSAYRIESNKLYDTTKRLADVSAGLGVDMGRLILAYGQVKAAAYLRGSEVRQFTEAGVNMYGELQNYFKEVKGEAYTTTQIVDMISKRMVTFQDVEAVFQRMTDKGGMFYNMQEIQANTLSGMIQKMHDAFDVMLNDIGKSNEGVFKGSIQFATNLLNHWEAIANVAKALLSIVVAIKVNSMFMQSNLGKAFILNAAMVGRWRAFLDLIKSAPTALGKMRAAISAVGDSLKAALGGAAFYAVFQTIMNYIDAWNQFDDTIRKARESTIDTLGKISELSAKYGELSNVKYKAQNNIDDSKAINEKRKALNKLIEQANRDGLEIKIDITGLNEPQLDKEFETLKKRYTDFAFELEAIKERAAQSDKKGWWWGVSGIKEGLDEYKTAAIDIISQTNKIEKAMALANIGYKDASGFARMYFETLRNGRKDGETDIDYLRRMNEAWKGLERYYSYNSMTLPDWLIEGQEYMKGMSDSFDDLRHAMYQTEENFKDVFVGKGGVEEFKKKYQKDPIKLKVEIDQYAADNSLSDTQKRLLYEIATKKYGIKFPAEIDDSDTEPAIKTIIEDLQEYADKNKIKISVQVKDPKNLNDTIGDYQKSAKDWQETIDNIKRSKKKYFTGAYLDIGNMEKWGSQYVNSYTVFSKKEALKYAEAQKEAAMYWNDLLGGKDPFEKKNKNREKEQRDILQERISLLKDMNAKYNDLIKTESQEVALTKTRKYFKEAAQNVGFNANDILPDDKSIAKRIREIGNQYKDVGKRGNALRVAADIDLNVSKTEYDKLKEDISRNIEDSFSQLQLYKKLKNEGLSDMLVKNMFGDITTSFEDIRNSIDDEFNKYIFKDYESKYGSDINKWGESIVNQYNKDISNTADVLKERFGDSDIYKQYLDQVQKLDKQVYQDQVEQTQELIKAYKQHLSDQLQLDKWYFEERNKLENDPNIDPDLKKQLQANLDAQYKKKTGENTWKNFQGSDMYVKIFENLDHTSTKVLDYMIQRLQSLRDEMKNLDPTQVKAITEQISKLQETRNSRNPFKAFTSGLKELVKYTKEYKKLGGDNALISTSDKYDKEEKNIENQGKIIANLDAEYNKSMLLNGLDDEKTKTLKTNLDLSKNQLDNMKKQHSETKGTLDTLNNVQGETDNAKNKFSKSVTDITSIVSSMATAFNGLFEALGGSDEQLENTLSVVDNIGQAIGSYYSGNYAGVVSGAMGALTGVAKLFSNEGKIDKEIAHQERAVNSLRHAYEKLKKSMDDAFDTQRLYEYNQKSVDALKKQQNAYQAMINAERGRKKPDEGKIQEWEQQIDDLNTTIKELGESMTEALGGFGSQSNYKSAAEAFSEAWVDAFNEGSDALEALNNKFDEYFNTMLTKQLMNRATSKYIQPILEAFDKAVSEGSEGGNSGLDVTKKELEGIKELKDKNLALFNEYAKNLMDVLNVKPTGSSNISALQQGIQSVTESTAQALESLLNSMRYYLATQQADVRIIRDTLIERLGASVGAVIQDANNSPVLIELRLQTTLLTDIRDTLSSCVKSGHSQGNKGIKVFMN